MCVWAALCLPMFVACEEDEDDNLRDGREVHNKIERSDNIFFSEIFVNQTLTDLYDVVVTYEVNGKTSSEVVDLSAAEKRTASVYGTNFEVLGVLVSKKITDRPVKMTVNAQPKSSFDALVDAMNTDKIDLVYFVKCGNVNSESDVSFSKYLLDSSIKTSLGADVKKVKENKRTLLLGSLTVG